MAIKNDFVRKYLFWILQAVTLLTILICWFLGTMATDKKAAAESTKIKGKFNTLDSISSTDKHPNEKTLKQLDADTKNLSKTVMDSWKDIYEKQKTVLVWPEDLRPDFIRKVTSLGPPENLTGQLTTSYENRYRNHISEEVIKLPHMIGYPEDKDDKSRPFCLWDEGSQSKAVARLQFKGTPSTIKLMYIQEDLWAYQTLLTIIDRANGGIHYKTVIKKEGKAKTAPQKTPETVKTDPAGKKVVAAPKFNVGHYNAVVKEILTLNIANDVKPRSKSPQFIDLKKGRSIESDEEDSADDDSSDGNDSDDEGNEPAPWIEFAQGRYVDANGEKLTGSKLAHIPKDEFKRMPIYMKVIVDQRRLTDLLVQCANSPLTVEVSKISFKEAKKEEERASSSDPNAVNNQALITIWDLEVEIYGVIYIFNPPPKEQETKDNPEDE